MRYSVSLLGSSLLGIGAASIAVGLAFGCSSSSGSPEGNAQDASGGAEGSTAGDAGSPGADSGHPGDSGNGGLAPDALYGCATMGGFGWTCTAATSGAESHGVHGSELPRLLRGRARRVVHEVVQHQRRLHGPR